MYTSIYIEVNIICIIIVLFILYKGKQNVDKQIENIAFVRAGLSILLLLVLDIIWVLIDSKIFKSSIEINTIINCFFLFQTGVVSYFWFQFVEYKIYKQKTIKKTYKFLIRIPLILLLFVSVATPWTKWLFNIDSNNIYHRGPFHFIQIVVAYGYLLFAAIHPLIKYIKEKNRVKRAEYLVLVFFIILPAVGGVLQIMFYGLPTTWAGASLSLLIVYMDLQEQQISTDGLTGLNNRRQLDKHLHSKASETHKRKRLFLLLMDINSFKKINDCCGHVEGDRALIYTANLLKNISYEYNAFLARYGGDEFAIVCECEDFDVIDKLQNEIENRFDFFNSNSDLPYTITLGIGCAECPAENVLDETKLISEADKKLYLSKKNQKSKLTDHGIS